MRALFPTALIAALLAVSLPAAAHTVGMSRGEYRHEGALLRADIVFAREELTSAVAHLDRDDDGVLTAPEISSGRAVLEAALVDGLEVRTTSGGCRGELERAELVPNNGIAVRLRYRCGEAESPLRLRLPLLTALSPGHRHLAAVITGTAGPVTQVVYEARPAFEIDSAPTTTGDNAVAGPLFVLGVEHILAGADHLLFLLGVVLVGGRLRTLVVAVTAFTLAHSVTLGLAALNVVAPSPSLIEPLIALSIVYVGIENWFVGDASRRWRLTFPFGLIHGFGFAGALQEVAVPGEQLPLALLSFNLGVEAGQLLALALALPGLLWLRRQSWFAVRGVRATSLLIAVAGLGWFVQRIS